MGLLQERHAEQNCLISMRMRGGVRHRERKKEREIERELRNETLLPYLSKRVELIILLCRLWVQRLLQLQSKTTLYSFNQDLYLFVYIYIYTFKAQLTERERERERRGSPINGTIEWPAWLNHPLLLWPTFWSPFFNHMQEGQTFLLVSLPWWN